MDMLLYEECGGIREKSVLLPPRADIENNAAQQKHLTRSGKCALVGLTERWRAKRCGERNMEKNYDVKTSAGTLGLTRTCSDALAYCPFSFS